MNAIINQKMLDRLDNLERLTVLEMVREMALLDALMSILSDDNPELETLERERYFYVSQIKSIVAFRK